MSQGFSTRCGWGFAHSRGPARLQSAAVRGFFLEVRQSNAAAQALYSSIGFETIGTRRNYYPAHAGREDAIVMELEL